MNDAAPMPLKRYRVLLSGLEWDHDCDVPVPPGECMMNVESADPVAAEQAAYSAAESRYKAVIDSGKGNVEVSEGWCYECGATCDCLLPLDENDLCSICESLYGYMHEEREDE